MSGAGIEFGRRTGFVPPRKTEVPAAQPSSAEKARTTPVAGSSWLDAFAPLLVGLGAFWAVVGFRVLDPTNIAWLREGDAATHYIGWMYFRSTEWMLPVGANPRYGLELASSIVYSDSNPLLALLFKPFSPWLPDTFQYFGIWLLACFVLQAVFGWMVTGLVSKSVVVRALGAALFAFSPPMIWRVQAHLNLAGHFLILAALFIALDRKLERKFLAWAILIGATTFLHAYILAMVLAIWLADLVMRAIEQRVNPRTMALEILSMAALVWLIMWQTGYFTIGEMYVAFLGGGYGYYRLNLLSIFDPSGWSSVLPDLPEAQYDYEGFNYLGLGVLFLLLCAIPPLLSGRLNLTLRIRRFGVLAVALAGLALFAISFRVGLGTETLELPFSVFLLERFQILRASGRIFWPVFYMIVFFAIYATAVGYRARVATLLLLAAVVLQVADTSAGWRPIREHLMVERSSDWEPELTGAFWDSAASHYDKLRRIPPASKMPENWATLAHYAARHGMATDVAYLARFSDVAFSRLQADGEAAVANGTYDLDTLYVLDPTLREQALASVDPMQDLLAEVDGVLIVAPGWKVCDACAVVPGEIQPRT